MPVYNDRGNLKLDSLLEDLKKIITPSDNYEAVVDLKDLLESQFENEFNDGSIAVVDQNSATELHSDSNQFSMEMDNPFDCSMPTQRQQNAVYRFLFINVLCNPNLPANVRIKALPQSHGGNIDYTKSQYYSEPQTFFAELYKVIILKDYANNNENLDPNKLTAAQQSTVGLLESITKAMEGGEPIDYKYMSFLQACNKYHNKEKFKTDIEKKINYKYTIKLHKLLIQTEVYYDNERINTVYKRLFCPPQKNQFSDTQPRRSQCEFFPQSRQRTVDTAADVLGSSPPQGPNNFLARRDSDLSAFEVRGCRANSY